METQISQRYLCAQWCWHCVPGVMCSWSDGGTNLCSSLPSQPGQHGGWRLAALPRNHPIDLSKFWSPEFNVMLATCMANTNRFFFVGILGAWGFSYSKRQVELHQKSYQKMSMPFLEGSSSNSSSVFAVSHLYTVHGSLGSALPSLDVSYTTSDWLPTSWSFWYFFRHFMLL